MYNYLASSWGKTFTMIFSWISECKFIITLNSPNDYVHYLSQFELEESGEWVIDIEIESEKGKSLTILDFIVSDEVRAGYNNIWGTILFLLVCVSFLTGIFWLKISSNRIKKRQN